ncbi:MAG: hypothetical protein KDD69_13585 [Bdellovibrionales bacterium]|nr:hypothetical protein [Bdellovibrionales bacterium]
MWLQWFPWKYIVRRVARGKGFIDPITILGHLHRFQEPSEVAEPLELLRAGMVFHARGLLNTKAIQHNLDWVWPYWVTKQFDPKDPSFIPRAFSVTHINLTHRNWTAVGLPGEEEMPVVDPRGLVMPFWDSWSLDAWIQGAEGEWLLPCRLSEASQEFNFENGLTVRTRCRGDGIELTMHTWVERIGSSPVCRTACRAKSANGGTLVVAIRPYNPEGVSFIQSLVYDQEEATWCVNDADYVVLSPRPDQVRLSDYRTGDVFSALCGRSDLRDGHETSCNVGLATGAALFQLRPGAETEVTCDIPLRHTLEAARGVRSGTAARESADNEWQRALKHTCRVQVPDPVFQRLYDQAVRTVVLLSPADVYPGPFTYRRFWFRDAAFMLNAMLALGLVKQAHGVIERFPERQLRNGYYRSQEGEWDSNGQVLWILNRLAEVTGTRLSDALIASAKKGTAWLAKKRLSDAIPEAHAGLLPAGFSAEHLGPNDYYYWDDFWALAGWRAAQQLFSFHGHHADAATAEHEGSLLEAAIERSFTRLRVDPLRAGIPASPHRRMDAGAVGSLAAGYPLALYSPDDPRVLATVETLYRDFSVHGAFFQDMIHSGLNAYLTLHMAQVLLRAGDARAWTLMKTIAGLASSTGQWPEAIHPQTGGGCMGDGQHGWAAAEWVLMLRNCFVLEEHDRLIIGAGIPRHWLGTDTVLACGPTPTRFGTVSVKLTVVEQTIHLSIEGNWHAEAPTMELALPSEERRPVRVGSQSIMYNAPVPPLP